MPTVMITGANRGLGLEFARQYGADGWRVLATCREPDKADALRALGGEVEVHPLDVADHRAVEALSGRLAGEAIDLLLNNAGIYGPRTEPEGDDDYRAWAEVLRINSMAPYKLARCFAGHVTQSEKKLIVTVTSKMGSMADNTSGGSSIYRSSKAALNAVMKSMANDLAGSGVTVCVLHPGWVRTDMGGPGALIDAPESVSGMRRVIAGLGPGDSGGFFDFEGNRVPW